jgi:hypothetical protein
VAREFVYRGKPAEDELRRGSGMRDGLRTLTDVAAAFARANAPERTGDYRSGIRARVDLESEGYVGYVIGEDFKTVWIELGTGEPLPTPAFQPLRRGVEAAGISLAVIGSSL